MMMKVFDQENDLALASARMLADCIQKKPDALFCFAAGLTQASTYKAFCGMVKRGEVDVSRIRVVGLDDMVGTARAKQEGFYYFLDTHLFGDAGIKDSQIAFFDASAPDLAAECARISAYLDANGPIDFLLLGIGMNGHIGYNEPGSPMDGRAHLVALEASSQAVGSAYFTHDVHADQGITLGLADLFAARNILVQAVGAKKADIVGQVVSGPITAKIPASLLRNRADVVWYFDAPAAAKL